MSDSESLNGVGLFEEPEDFLPEAPKHHFITYKRENISSVSKSKKQDIELRLVGSSPLWGHLLWNAGKYTAMHLESHPDLLLDKNVLELGAAGALPSIISSLVGAKETVVTDYPDPELISNIKHNCRDLSNARVEGYIWGNSYEDILPSDGSGKFQLIILSDLVFNHTEHYKLLKTTKDLLDKNGKALVVFSPHRPKLLDDDLHFFEKAEKEFNFNVQKIEMTNWKPMFDEDEETVEIRSRIYAYYLTL
ncbi:hypothetical protein KAFR_0A04900 [Kazachstania africana CBS 2517]|uniref:Protein N-terminal and lysine N-methyltransferase EFM7 n=1 Tax=Kazachstania africana (strain ATCC 22294 / BCRC 22015 / CBS 2517 / CECT 1963 / NBRC 1671 / NRRL Y-8276) TaxID=1071382 RepID=H2ANH6_KAZAF|nr:hypothetical protein KAFR_0A04900 [Kazachstania africana CBS 2517]CCF55926.1 hypothetical protein KAFR_0A04900 [Kazachstania africana CBS 2517]